MTDFVPTLAFLLLSTLEDHSGAVGTFRWRPGIGDPTVGGWVTVILYVAATLICWAVVRLLSRRNIVQRRESKAWRVLTALFCALGINKQLDLQTALTEVGRMLARSEGWYDNRAVIQVAFAALVGLLCAAAAFALWLWVADAPPATRLALLGTVFVFGYVAVRAASFHHVDALIGRSVLGFRWNWVFEMGGIAIVGVAGVWRLLTRPSAARPSAARPSAPRPQAPRPPVSRNR